MKFLHAERRALQSLVSVEKAGECLRLVIIVDPPEREVRMEARRPH